MGEESAIGWTDGTFNPWWGCVEVSDACDNCYAREWDKRFSGITANGTDLGDAHWGKDAPRRIASDKYWREPVKWNNKIGAKIKAWEAGGRVGPKPRFLVFCASMADVFETYRPRIGGSEDGQSDPNVDPLDAPRARLWQLIRDTPNLTWLLLTKRPQNIERMLPEDLRGAPHIWLGTTVESMKTLWRRDALAKLTWAKVRFLSMEPLLEMVPIDLTGIDWLITGCESGDGARETPTDWYRVLRRRAEVHGVPFFLKQAPVGADGITEGPGSKRKRDLRTGPDGIKRVHWIIGEPYLDGVQHVAWPEAA